MKTRFIPLMLAVIVTVGCTRIAELFSGSSSNAQSGEVREGMCLQNPTLPDVVMRIHKVGETLVSFQSNLTGDILTQYDKAELEDELRIGTTVEASCDYFNKK